ncbi:MAG: putative glycosyltransferase [Actinomycetia bacterium]|nr:putative glycosyltransferase [Actinomycetes bacterium]
MRLTFLADLRSPIAVQWIRYFVDRGHEVQAISSYPISGDVLPGADTTSLPLVLPGHGRDGASAPPRPHQAHGSSMKARVRHWATPGRVAAVRSFFGPTLVYAKRGRLQRLVDQHRPDLVHAMRIPFEGIAAGALTGLPVIVSVWGNDFTLFADRTRMMAKATRRALATAEVLHCDCHRDARMAREWGFPADRPTWVVPGNGGVDACVFHLGRSDLRQRLGIPEQATVILNPRGIREYVRTDTFFKALPPVLRSFPEVHVVCPGMAGSHYAENMIIDARLDRRRVHLLPTLDHRLMADAFRSSRLSVSLSEHDGTPNTLLEAMACGALPVVGDVDSVREWIRDGINGLVVSARDPAAVSAALMRSLKDDTFVRRAGEENERLVRDRADYQRNMLDVESRYEMLVRSRSTRGAEPVVRQGNGSAAE